MKNKKLYAIITGCLLLIQCACISRIDYQTTKEPIQTVQNWSRGKQKSARVLEVVKTSGESIVFSEQEPGHIENNTVSGTDIESLPITIETTEIKKSTYRQKDNSMAVETIDGKFYVLYSPNITDTTISGIAKRLYDGIPFSDIDWLWVKQVHNVGINAVTSIVQSIAIGILAIVGLGIAGDILDFN